MTLSKYIKLLQTYEKEYGKKKVVYSTDDEGNSFNTVNDFIFGPGHYQQESGEFSSTNDPEEARPPKTNSFCIN